MNRARWTLLGVVLVLLWGTRFVVDPRPVRGPTDAAAEEQLGSAAFEAARWWEAASHYRAAFALQDAHVAERLPQQAQIAHRTAQSYARMVTEGAVGAAISERRRAQNAAEMWIDEALALDASRGWLHYERAVLLDRAPAELREPLLAREAYTAFVQWVEDAERPGADKPKVDHPAVAEARTRIEALSG